MRPTVGGMLLNGGCFGNIASTPNLGLGKRFESKKLDCLIGFVDCRSRTSCADLVDLHSEIALSNSILVGDSWSMITKKVVLPVRANSMHVFACPRMPSMI